MMWGYWETLLGVVVWSLMGVWLGVTIAQMVMVLTSY